MLNTFLYSACSSQALEKFGPSAVALAAFKNAVNTKSFHLLEIPQGSSLIEALQQKVDLQQETSESVVGGVTPFATTAWVPQYSATMLLQ